MFDLQGVDQLQHSRAVGDGIVLRPDDLRAVAQLEVVSQLTAEVSGGGYARKIINFSAPSLVSGKEQVSNSAPVDFGTLTADLGTVAYWGIYDALTAGNLLWYGSFTRSKNVLNGDAITVSAGAIVCTLA